RRRRSTWEESWGVTPQVSGERVPARRRLAAKPTEGVPVPQDVYQHTFANGLTLLAERMEHVRSAALNFLVPAGCAYDPPGQLGLRAMLAHLITRGARARPSRALTRALH